MWDWSWTIPCRRSLSTAPAGGCRTDTPESARLSISIVPPPPVVVATAAPVLASAPDGERPANSRGDSMKLSIVRTWAMP